MVLKQAVRALIEQIRPAFAPRTASFVVLWRRHFEQVALADLDQLVIRDRRHRHAHRQQLVELVGLLLGLLG